MISKLQFGGLLAMVFGFGLITPAQAQLVFSTTLVGGGGSVGAQQGFSVGLAADGNTAIVGAPLDNPFLTPQGAAWIFTRTSGSWGAGGAQLASGTGGTLFGISRQGASVAMSGDGNTALVGGPNETAGGANAGAVWFYALSGSSFAQQGGINNGVANAKLGSSGALSQNGNTAIVGAPGDNGGAGTAWVYTRKGGVWSLQTTLSAASTVSFGASVSISDDGNLVLVGAPGTSANAGSAWVFTRSGTTWSTGTQLPAGTPAIAGGRQGLSVSVAGTAQTAMVGGFDSGTGTGAAYVYTLTGEVGTLQARLMDGSAGTAQQGASVSISNDGNTALVGGPNDSSGHGAVWQYTRSTSGPVTWTQMVKLTGTGNAGFSVALSGDATTALAGAPAQGAGGATLAFGSPDLSITNVHNGTFHRGDNGDTYTITVTNVGAAPTDGTTVTVVQSVPNGVTPVSISGSGWTCPVGVLSPPPPPAAWTLTCTRSDVKASGAAYPIITFTVNVSVGAPIAIGSVAKVSGGGDTNPSNNTGIDSVNFPGAPDLAISMSHSGNFSPGQLGATYRVTVSNVGDGPTNGGLVSVTATIPAGLTLVSMTGPSWSCGGATCTRSDALAATKFYDPITVTVNVTALSGTVTSSATVSGGGDVTPANNTAHNRTTIASGPDLIVTSTHLGNFQQGQSGAMYLIAATNAGGAPTRGTVTVTDTVPGSLTVTAVGGKGWTCQPAPAVSCTRTNGLAAGLSYPFVTITMTVAGNAPASVTNSASVSGGGDTNNGNNTGTDPTTITHTNSPTFPDLTVAISHVGNFVRGTTGNYSIVVTNSGGGATSGAANMLVSMPVGLQATALAGAGWTCDVPTLKCTRIDPLPAANSYAAITLTVSVARTAPGSVVTSVSVSGGNESNTLNNAAADATTITN
jgi:uncharacterized repeat protein (TIGR01451 family)